MGLETNRMQRDARGAEANFRVTFLCLPTLYDAVKGKSRE